MNASFDDLSPDERDRIGHLRDFWNPFAVCDEFGGATREVLESLQLEVTECLYERPPDISKAESLTAHAMLVMTGWSDR